MDLGLLGDVFSKFFMKHNSSPPLIPLCRLIPNEAISTVSSQVDVFRDSFDSHGYVSASSPFLVSLMHLGSPIYFDVTPLDLHEWEGNWLLQHEAFDNEVDGTEWDDLKGKKFLVWDGNHRVRAWMSCIHERKFKICLKFSLISMD